MEIELAKEFVDIEEDHQPTSSPVDEKVANARAATRMKRGQNKGNGRYDSIHPIQNEGELVARKPLTPLEAYAQALLLSNEASYIN